MTKFIVPATILQRFTALYNSLASAEFQVLKLEISNGKCYLIGSNEYVACVEYLGDTDQADDKCYIKMNTQFINSVALEFNVGGVYKFETLPELAMGSTSTTSNQQSENFIVWPDNSPLDNWREWFTTSEQSDGAMYCNLKQIESLWGCSPTGEIVFPEVINAVEPVIVRDVNDANWLGVFIPSNDDKKIIKPATLPEWL